MALTSQQASEIDGLFLDVARKIQLSPTKHTEAERAYLALCEYVEREGSPLQGKVTDCYPGGSFATGTVVSSVTDDSSHDVDTVVELQVEAETSPSKILNTFFLAVNGEPGSKYFGKVVQNSRCIAYGTAGRVMAGSSAAAIVSPARGSTNTGGGEL